MNVGQVILDRPWLFDKNVTIYGQSNMCQFEYKGEKIKLLSLRAKIRQLDQALTTSKKNKWINLISAKVLDKKNEERSLHFLGFAADSDVPSRLLLLLFFFTYCRGMFWAPTPFSSAIDNISLESI